MPLTPAYTWSENDTVVRISIHNVPIKDQSQIFCSDRVVKLNAAPYLLLLDLKDTIDDDRSTATVSGGRDISLQLVKSRPGLWGSLAAEGNKATIKQQREESIHRAHQKQIAAQLERLARKQKEEKVAVDRQIAEEKSQRARLDSLKERELQDQRQQLQDWKQQLPNSQKQHLHAEQQHISANNALGDESDYQEDLPAAEAASAAQQAARSARKQPALLDHPDYYGRGWRPDNTNGPQTATADSACSNSNQQEQSGCQDIATLTASSGKQPGILQSLIIDVAGADGHDTLTKPCNPGNAAHSPHDNELLLTAVKSSRSNSNSSTLQQLEEQQAIQPATPPTKPQAPVRCRAAPVAVTFTQLQTSHLPAREQREIEIKDIKRQAKGDSVDISDRQPAFLKDKGDALAGQGNYRGAINAYSRALELDSQQPALWSNRAACHLALGAAEDCQTDCTAAIQLLQAMHDTLVTAGTAAGEDQELLAGLLPPAAASVGVASDSSAAAAAAAAAALEDAQPNGSADALCLGNDVCNPDSSRATADVEVQLSAGSSSDTVLQKVVHLLVKVLSRRAAARVELQQMQEANDDLQQALKLAPDDLQLKADALEVAAALDPAAAAQPINIKQRADARFKAGDLQGAIEAYASLMDMLKQQQHQAEQQQRQEEGTTGEVDLQGIEAMSRKQGHDQQQQLLLLAALSNRAACWLSLEQYQACVNDCSAALHLTLNTATAMDTVESGVDSSNGQGRCSSSRATPAAETDATTGGIHTSAEAVAASNHVQPEAGSLSHVMQVLGIQPPQQVLAVAGPARVRSIARLLGRAAVACGCLKQLQHAIYLYDCAQGYWQAVGDAKRAVELEADKHRLQQMLGAMS